MEKEKSDTYLCAHFFPVSVYLAVLCASAKHSHVGVGAASS